MDALKSVPSATRSRDRNRSESKSKGKRELLAQTPCTSSCRRSYSPEQTSGSRSNKRPFHNQRSNSPESTSGSESNKRRSHSSHSTSSYSPDLSLDLPDPEHISSSLEETENPLETEGGQADEEILTLDEGILTLLGEEKENTKPFEIHKVVKNRWQTILSQGLDKEERKDLLAKHIIPSNLKTLSPPEMNPEILAALPGSAIKNERYQISRQTQLGKGIAALGTALNLLLKNKIKSAKAVERSGRDLKQPFQAHNSNTYNHNDNKHRMVAKMNVKEPLEPRQGTRGNFDRRGVILKLKEGKKHSGDEIKGLLVSACPAIKYAKMYTRMLEREKYKALQRCGQNYNRVMSISDRARLDLNWWKRQVMHSKQEIKRDLFKLEIFSDASKTGWGAYCEGRTTHGWWSALESAEHINFLELMAVFYSLKCFTADLRTCNILLRIDNTTAISYINRMGSVQYPKLNDLSRQIWQWCEARDLWLCASYIGSKENKADESSREDTPNVSQSYPGSREIVRKAFIKMGHSEETVSTSIESISASTLKQYNSSYQAWWKFCRVKNIDPYSADSSGVLAFMQHELNTKASRYGTFNQHRSALSLILPGEIGKDILIRRFLKEPIKTTRFRGSQPVLEIPYFLENPKLCVASTLLSYIEKTADIRSEFLEALIK
ncbi:hypothetical protein NQ317_006676 [Molorchus minor]|uniref:Reverse transcriptase RNase H-like domain-containing protein n=1 Tax=Molorchus minor TaxID=1323400 RepID=A0ABQ9IPR6_9CUCU|nr:hypothetical protein NQ317_006676 [Molorchus minor]